MKKHRAQNSNVEYLMSKNEYKWVQEIEEVFKDTNLAKNPQFVSKLLSKLDKRSSNLSFKERI